ncbi:MAG: NUDIX hydrolase [Thermomicrobiales bacterium]
MELPQRGLDNDESVLEGAVRETREETGLEIAAERVIYVHEVIHRLSPPGATERRVRQVDFYVLASSYAGEIRTADPAFLDAGFVSRDDLRSAAAYPPMLEDLF